MPFGEDGYGSSLGPVRCSMSEASDEECEDEMICSICERSLLISMLPRYGNGEAKGNVCTSCVNNDHGLRHHYMQKCGPAFKDEWAKLNRDRKRKRAETIADGDTHPAEGRGKKRIKYKIEFFGRGDGRSPALP